MEKIKIIFLVVYLLFFANLALGAELFLQPDKQSLNVGSLFRVDFLITSLKESVNAIEGKIFFSKDILELSEIIDGNSVINLWPQKPEYSENEGSVVFAGITPGGFQSDDGQIFSLIFKAKKQGIAIVSIQQAKALLNDGLGTAASLITKNCEMQINEQASSVINNQFEIKNDINPPEPFELYIACDPNIFEGKNFLVFTAQDKGLGISHYEIQETKNNQQGNHWQRAKSPYVLQDQALKSYVFVKAIDKAGNERIAILKPKSFFIVYKNYLIWGIILLTALIVYFLLWKKYKKK